MLPKPKKTKFTKSHKGRCYTGLSIRRSAVTLKGHDATTRHSPKARSAPLGASPAYDLGAAAQHLAAAGFAHQPQTHSGVADSPEAFGAPRPAAGSKGGAALIAKQAGRITAAQIWAAQLAIKRKLKPRRGSGSEAGLWTRVFPHFPVTQKPAEVRMGKGKGAVEYWMTRVRAGSVLFEISSPSEALARRALLIAQSKLPVATTLLIRPARG